MANPLPHHLWKRNLWKRIVRLVVFPERFGSPRAWGTALLWLAVTGAAAFACSGSPDEPPPIQVPESYHQVREVRGHKIHIGKAGLECTDCHDLSQGGFTNPGPAPCVRCHQEQAQIHHAVPADTPDALSNCMDCHVFKNDPEQARPERGPWDCGLCHFHPQGDLPAVTVHRSTDCKTCHSPHGPAPAKRQGCPGCHQDVKTTHASVGIDAVQVCTNCHQRHHAPGIAARGTCDECHRSHEPIVPATALFEPGHTSCSNCHVAHNFEKEQAKPCTECHTDRHVLAENVPAHADCKSCHPPHNARFDANLACAGCHRAEKMSDHPQQKGQSPHRFGGERNCTGCHQIHPKKAGHAVVETCSSCHREASNDLAFHAPDVACTACHKPHQFLASAATGQSCKDCHREQLSAVHALPGHQDCKQCHTSLPHHMSAPLACETCHQQEHDTAPQGHSQCLQCHDPHSGGMHANTSCTTCHQTEHQSRHGNVQGGCTTCHRPHGPKGPAKPPACTSCHQTEHQGLHGNLQGGCTTCHQPHGPKGQAPACTSCHKPQDRDALHRVAQHTNCGDCHAGHQKMLPDEPGRCRTCHDNIQDHFPGTNRCSGCHLFKQL